MTTATHHTNHNDKGLLNPLATQAFDTAKELGSRAVSVASDGIEKAQEITQNTVRKYPMAAVGVALGSGIAIGVLGYRMWNPPKPTLTQRLSDMALGSTAISLFRKLF